MRVLLCLLLLFAPVTAAHAKWYRADSGHFVVYADDSESDITSFARQLERFHSALEVATGKSPPLPSPSNRVTVYVVSSVRAVKDLYRGTDKYVQGFYLPRAGASVAVVPRVDPSSRIANESMVVLLHEYVHHFYYETSSFPTPRWLTEGTAEFFSTASFDENGDVTLGRPSQMRAPELMLASDVDAEQLLDPAVYEAHHGKSKAYDDFYGKSWLLYHYLTFSPDRAGQLQAYIANLVAGKSQRQAALDAFGDFHKLDRELDLYMKSFRMKAITIRAAGIKESAVTTRALSDGEAAMMDVVIQSKVGVDHDQAVALLPEARQVAARFPHDAAVLSALAEAEHDAGNFDASIAAADAALAIDPQQVNAYVQKGYSLFAKAKDADDMDRAYSAALQPFLRLNRLENDHPIPLIYFYRSFLDRGKPPSKMAINGLERAAELAPFDLELRMMAGREELDEGRFKEARFNLTPVAFNPHGGDLADMAAQMLASIDGKKDVPVAARQ